MAAASITCLRYGRFVVDSILNVKRLPTHRLKLKHVVAMQKWMNVRNFSATTSENVKGNRQSENDAELTDANKDKKEIDNLNKEIENLNKEIVELTEQVQMFKDKYQRSLAESENLRIRYSKQVEDAKIFGIQSFCKDLLEVSDILQRATESVPKEELNNNNPHLKNLYEGLVMTEAQLQNVFRRHGLEPVNPINQQFNPNLHEALFQQEVEGIKPGTVVVVSKIGYKLHDRVIRPALVGVSKSCQ